MKKVIVLYKSKGEMSAKLTGVAAENFISGVFEFTEPITLKSGDKAYRIIEDELFKFGDINNAVLGIVVFFTKGDFFRITYE